MRQLKRAISDCIFCRRLQSTVFLIVSILFLVYLVRPYFSNSNLHGTQPPPHTDQDTALHEQYRKFAVERGKVLNGEQDTDNVVRKRLFPFRRHEEIDEKKREIRKESAVVMPKVVDPPKVQKQSVRKVLPVVETSKKQEIQQPTLSLARPVMAVLMIACNRVEVSRSLDLVLKYKPSNVEIPVVVSQDCGHEATAQVIKGYGNKVTHIRQPELGDVPGVPANLRRFMTYHKISRHYKWALTEVFKNPNVDSVVIVEDDLEIGRSFHNYVSQIN